MRIIKLKTKAEVIGLALLMLCIGVGNIYGTLLKDPVGTTPGYGFYNPTYIWNSNGQSWIATGPNLQASLNLSGVTYFPGNTTIYTNTSILLRNSSCLIGYGWTSVLKAGAGLGNVPLIVNDANYPPTHTNHDIEVRNLKIDGADPTHIKSVGGFNYGVLFAKVTWGTVDNVYVKDLGKDGVRAFNSNHITFSYITVNNTGNHGVFMGYGTYNSSISHVDAYHPKTEAVCIEWSEQGTSRRNENIQISDVNCYGNEQHGLYLADTNYAIVSNYVATNSSSWGFIVRNSSYITMTSCDSNKNVVGDGVLVDAGTNHIHLDTFTIKNVVAGSPAFKLLGDNITLENSEGSLCGAPVSFAATSRNVTVTHCEFYTYSVYVTILGKDVELSYNRFLRQTGASILRAINIDSASVGSRVIGNDVRNVNCTSRKIELATSGCPSAVVRDNPGFPTEYYMRAGATIPMGLGGVYSTPVVLQPLTQHVVAPIMWIRNSAKVNASETVTYSIQAIYQTGAIKYLNKTIVGPALTLTYWYNLTNPDWITLSSLGQSNGGERLLRFNVYAKTTNATTSAAVVVYLLSQG